ncbi:hypothetical protein TNCV_2088001 [Trichonephila clavipes]|nr:hypothetical protein TNCV_2088001 [Trichonephila clavipes]
MRDYERLIIENNSDIDSDKESKISVNNSGSNESLLSDFSCGVDRMNQHLTNYPITKKKRLDIIDGLIERHGAVNEKKERSPGILPNLLRLTEKDFL